MSNLLVEQVFYCCLSWCIHSPSNDLAKAASGHITVLHYTVVATDGLQTILVNISINLVEFNSDCFSRMVVV